MGKRKEKLMIGESEINKLDHKMKATMEEFLWLK